MQNSELRPLGAGELLDRAITLYVRRFALIVSVLALVIVPLSALEALVAPQSAHAFSDFARVLSAAGNPSASRAAADAMARDNHLGAAAGLVLFGAAVLRLLMWCAIITVVTAAYAGTTLAVGAAYRHAVQRWIPQILVTLAFIVIGMFALIPVFMFYLLLLVVAVALSALNQIIALVIAMIVGGLILIAGMCAIGSLIFMSYELASVAVVTETGNAIEAIGIGLRRAFAPGMKRRTMVGGLVLLLVSQAGAIPLIALAAIVSATTHVDALYFAVLSVGAILLDGLIASFVVVYAVDARVRREGLDIVVPPAPPIPA